MYKFYFRHHNQPRRAVIAKRRSSLKQLQNRNEWQGIGNLEYLKREAPVQARESISV